MGSSNKKKHTSLQHLLGQFSKVQGHFRHYMPLERTLGQPIVDIFSQETSLVPVNILIILQPPMFAKLGSTCLKSIENSRLATVKITALVILIIPIRQRIILHLLCENGAINAFCIVLYCIVHLCKSVAKCISVSTPLKHIISL